MGWSHTVSTAFRFTPFELKLVPGSPTTYLVDGQPRAMTPHPVTVTVRTPAGGLEPRQRTLWSTEHGPVMTGVLGLPVFPWTPATAWAMGDANAANFRVLNHFFETNHARSVRDLHRIVTRYQSVPWVNTIAADRSGEAYYADVSVVPNVPDDHAAACNTPVGRATFEALRLPVLDGSRSACRWLDDPDAVVPGIFGPAKLPSLFRTDYVTNSNDSYWLANPHQPLEGYARIIGDEGTERSLRTRSGLVMVDERVGHGRRFDLGDLQKLAFSNRQHAGELVRDDLVGLCRSLPGGLALSSSGPVDVSEACPVLEAWNLRDDLDSAGAVLFRRFWTRADDAAPDPWARGFDAADPVGTPAGLDTAHPQVQQALGDAVQDLRNAGIPLDAGLRGWQYERRGARSVPVHGGPGTLGVFNAINVSWQPDAGYPDVAHGSSFVMAAAFGGDCARARTILTYSQSANPASPWYADQTELFARKRWVTPPFCPGELDAARKLRVTHLR
jgi:acyl-homoserine-lactone acylase